MDRRLGPGVAASIGRVAIQAGRMAVTYGRQVFSGGKAALSGGKAAINGGKAAASGGKAVASEAQVVASGGKAIATGTQVAGAGGKAAAAVSGGSKASTTLANVGNGAMIASLALPLLPMLKSSPKAETPTPPAVDPNAVSPVTTDSNPTLPNANTPTIQPYSPPTSYQSTSLPPQGVASTPPVQPYPVYNNPPNRPASYQPSPPTQYLPSQPTSYYPSNPTINYGQPPVNYNSPPSNYVPQSYPLQKRGAVADKAGVAVTGLMVLGLMKQLYGYIAPKFKPQQQVTQAAPYTSTPQYPAYRRRSVDNQGELKSDDLAKRSIMNAAGHFVTVGFAFQALKDNTGPVFREIARLQHEGIHQIKQLTVPTQRQQQSQLAQYQQQHVMYKREVDTKRSTEYADEADVEKDFPMLRRASFMEHPAVGHGLSAAGVLVTVSMLTGMAGPYLDEGLKKFKNLMPASHTSPTPYPAYPLQYTPQYAPQYIKKRSLQPPHEKRPAEDRTVPMISSKISPSRALRKRFSFKKWFKKVFNKSEKIYNDKWVVKALAIVGWNPKSELMRW